MKILRMCKDMFDKTPEDTSIKGFFREMRKRENAKKDDDDNTDRGFFVLCTNYLGGRSYNRFLDYSLFAIKLNYIHNKWCTMFKRDDGKWSQWVEGTWAEMSKAILNLLADDRHDMWQNVQGEVLAVGVLLEAELQKSFWADVVDAMIDCINVEGTGDISVGFVIEE